MSETLISRNADLARLEAEGLRLRVVQGTAHHLLIDGVPAVNARREVVLGTLYSPLELTPEGRTANPVPSHQCWWIGDTPCDASGNVMQHMISNPAPENKGDNIRVDVGFSRKRVDKTQYGDYYEKIWRYIELIWHEARLIDPKCDPRSNRPVKAVVDAQLSIFHYPDMATTRAGIGAATAKLLAKKVAIIGVGGTGSYILDLLAKVPIEQIHIYDGDEFELHCAFRAPGAPHKDDLKNPKKVDWFGAIYDRMRLGIVRHPHHVTKDNVAELKDCDFVFVAIDDAVARKVILEGLIALKVPFIDVGIDMSLDQNRSLRGQARFTVGTPDHYRHIYEVVSFGVGPENEIYRNIQVADLNMLNAAMAVGKWKRMRGFYADDVHEHHSLYTIAAHSLTKEDCE